MNLKPDQENEIKNNYKYYRLQYKVLVTGTYDNFTFHLQTSCSEHVPFRTFKMTVAFSSVDINRKPFWVPQLPYVHTTGLIAVEETEHKVGTPAR